MKKKCLIILIFLFGIYVYGYSFSVPKLDFRNKFQASVDIWPIANNIPQLKVEINNAFKKLGVNYVILGGHTNVNNPVDKKWWNDILSWARKKGYIIAPGCMGPLGPFWEGMSPGMLKYLYTRYSDVLQIISFESENWDAWSGYIKPNEIILPGTDNRSAPKDVKIIPLKNTIIGHDIYDSYTDITKAMLLTWARNLKKIYEAAPGAKLMYSDPWIQPDITALLNEPYVKNLIPGEKSFGSVNIKSYKDLAAEGKITGWCVQLSSDGSPYLSYTPQYMERLLKRAIVEGADTWELQDNYYGLNVLFNNPMSPNAKLTRWGMALKKAIEFGHMYNKNKPTPVAWSPDAYIALLTYPNNTPSNTSAYQQLQIYEANSIFSGWGIPIFADDPYNMNAMRISSWGKQPFRLWYAPPYDIENFKYFNYKTFYYTTSLTPKTKVAILVGPGNMNEWTVNHLIKFCKNGGYVIQSCGAYIHNPKNGQEMLQFGKLEYYQAIPKKAFIFPKPYQMKVPLLEKFAGFQYEKTADSQWHFHYKVVNKNTPLVPFDYSDQYSSAGNSFSDYFFLKGKLIHSIPVVNIYDNGRAYPLIIYHPIGKGGVYTVLSWSLEGMTAGYLNGFIRDWFHCLIKKYKGNILKRNTVNIYDYEVYAGRLLNWKDKPDIIIDKGQNIGIVDNYLNKPIKRVFIIYHKSVEETIYNQKGKLKERHLLEGNLPQKISVILKPHWQVIFVKK